MKHCQNDQERDGQGPQSKISVTITSQQDQKTDSIASTLLKNIYICSSDPCSASTGTENKLYSKCSMFPRTQKAITNHKSV